MHAEKFLKKLEFGRYIVQIPFLIVL